MSNFFAALLTAVGTFVQQRRSRTDAGLSAVEYALLIAGVGALLFTLPLIYDTLQAYLDACAQTLSGHTNDACR